MSEPDLALSPPTPDTVLYHRRRTEIAMSPRPQGLPERQSRVAPVPPGSNSAPEAGSITRRHGPGGGRRNQQREQRAEQREGRSAIHQQQTRAARAARAATCSKPAVDPGTGQPHTQQHRLAAILTSWRSICQCLHRARPWHLSRLGS